MKNSIKYILTVAIFSFLIIACNSGKKMLEKGNYYAAVLKSVERLKTSPNNKKAQETLSLAYPHAVNSLLDKLDNNNARNYRFINTEAVYIYQDLNNMYEGIQSTPSAMRVITNPQKFYSQLSNVKLKAAEEQYSAGLEQLSLGNRENSKQAYYYFQEADRLANNYKDVASKIEESYNLSILKVLTYLTPIQSRHYQLSADVFYNEVHRTLRQIEQNEFIRFFSPEEAKLISLKNPDQYLTINFEDFIVGETHIKERIEKMEQDSVKVGTVTLPNGTVQDVLGTVKATVSINRMEVISKGIINLTINQTETKRIIINQDFRGDYVWFNEWGSYNGDERALTDIQFAICKRRRINPIPPQQMFVEFTKPIHSQLRNRLVSFYRDY